MTIIPNRGDYDFVISLGGSCNVSSQLRHRGLRTCSFPLDWTLMVDERPVRYLPAAFRTRFGEFCLHGNVFEYEPPAVEFGVVKRRVEDRATGFRFIHQFHAPVEDEAAFARERSVLSRRIDRLYESVARADNVLFVLSTVFPYDVSLAEDILSAAEEAFPSTNIELAAMQFSAERQSAADLCGGRLHVATYQRPVNIVYDNQLTAPEWSWMDQLSITGLPTPRELRKKRLATKWKYKLWMWLGRSLEAERAGCANMRFYKFSRYQ